MIQSFRSVGSALLALFYIHNAPSYNLKTPFIIVVSWLLVGDIEWVGDMDYLASSSYGLYCLLGVETFLNRVLAGDIEKFMVGGDSSTLRLCNEWVAIHPDL